MFIRSREDSKLSTIEVECPMTTNPDSPSRERVHVSADKGRQRAKPEIVDVGKQRRGEGMVDLQPARGFTDYPSSR